MTLANSYSWRIENDMLYILGISKYLNCHEEVFDMAHLNGLIFDTLQKLITYIVLKVVYGWVGVSPHSLYNHFKGSSP